MTSRIVALAALAAAVVAVFLLLTGGGSYTVNARFVEAGQMVKGGLIEVGGRTIGTVGEITLTDNGQANIEMNIDDEEYDPLTRGTTARIRTVGLSGVANRFIEITPGPQDGEEIPDGGVLSTIETRPIVDLDVFLNSFDEPTRKRIQDIFKSGATLFDGVTKQANTQFAYLAPFLSESKLLTDELARDRVAVERLVTTGATTATALASRDEDITQGISSTARVLRTLAAEREVLADTFERAPALLERPDGILGGLRDTLVRAKPLFREARPVTPRLATVLRKLVPTARDTVPVLAEVRGLLPLATRNLNSLPGLARRAVPALKSTTTSIIASQPAVDALRPYVPDLVQGFFNGLGGRTAGYYDANGHFGRISLQAGPTTLTGLVGSLLDSILGGNGPTLGVSNGNVARCPGGATGPAEDGSNPYIDKPSICDPTHDLAE